METSPLQCVLDTNIFIDFRDGGVLDLLFALPCTLLVPDLMLADEFFGVERKRLLYLGLEVRSLSGAEVREIIALGQRYHRPSFHDLAAFVLARSLGAVLLTGDGELRRMADELGMACHGTLWLLDELVDRGLLPPHQAAHVLTQMLAKGSRLPQGECARRLRRWNG